MALVEYSDSEADTTSPKAATPPPAKKRRISGPSKGEDRMLPPLPASFHDLYSSTVRTSTSDDPRLHGGRKRIVPHVEGNWAAHVYLEWHPGPLETQVLSDLIATYKRADTKQPTDPDTPKVLGEIHSLLESDLGVSIPLHVSLSRPLTLSTETKHDFLEKVTNALSGTGVKNFDLRPRSLDWHPNEDKSRYFLVLKLTESPNNELDRLLEACNMVASSFRQPLLYLDSVSKNIDAAKQKRQGKSEAQSTSPDDQAAELGNPTPISAVKSPLHDRFHISIAWSLRPPTSPNEWNVESPRSTADLLPPPFDKLDEMNVSFAEVKIRLGKDVSTVRLGAKPRAQRNSILG